MNGLGNDFLVFDARGAPVRPAPRRSRARDRERGRRLRPDDHPRARQFRRRRLHAHRQRRRRRGRGLRQRHALRRLAADARERARRAPRSRPMPGCWRAARRGGGRASGRHGRAALRLAGDPAGRGIPGHARHRAGDRADRRADAAFALGRQWAIRTRSSGSTTSRLRSRPHRADPREPSVFPGARQHLARPCDGAGRDHGAHLGARRRPDQGLRHGRLRRARLRGAHAAAPGGTPR